MSTTQAVTAASAGRVTPGMLGRRRRGTIVAVSLCLVAVAVAVAARAGSSVTVTGLVGAVLTGVLILFAARVQAPYGRVRGSALMLDAAEPLRLAAVLLLPVLLLPVVTALYCLTTRGRPWQWRLFNYAAHTTTLVFAAVAGDWAGRWSHAYASGSEAVAFLASAGMAIVVYLLTSNAAYTWIQYAVYDQTPSETEIWAPSSLGLDASMFCLGALLAFAVQSDRWMVVLAAPAFGMVVLLVRAVDRSGWSQLDAKTGLLTLPAFRMFADRELLSAVRRGTDLSLVMLDLDHFREVNSRFGHLVGDEVLRATCGAIGSDRRATDLVGRYGGEELIMLLPGAGGHDAAAVAELIRRRVADEVGPLLAAGYAVTASLGVAEWSGEESLDDLIRRADVALFAAKSEGRNRVVTAAGV